MQRQTPSQRGGRGGIGGIVVHHASLRVGLTGGLNCPPLTACINDLDQVGAPAVFDKFPIACAILKSRPLQHSSCGQNTQEANLDNEARCRSLAKHAIARFAAFSYLTIGAILTEHPESRYEDIFFCRRHNNQPVCRIVCARSKSGGATAATE
jgi:hypothetical protein